MAEPYSPGERNGAHASAMHDGAGDAASDHQRDLDALASKRLRIGMALTGVMMAIYFGFILLIAFAKPAMGELIVPGLSWGILLGFLVILATWGVTWIYVSWANKRYEPEIRRLRG